LVRLSSNTLRRTALFFRKISNFCTSRDDHSHQCWFYFFNRLIELHHQ
jgi:hypothetical protein